MTVISAMPFVSTLLLSVALFQRVSADRVQAYHPSRVYTDQPFGSGSDIRNRISVNTPGGFFGCYHVDVVVQGTTVSVAVIKD
eukprot:jgi/Hompol1/6649/HPOL_002880-RA